MSTSTETVKKEASEPIFSKKRLKLITDPLNDSNPVTVQVLGICSALAITVQLKPSIIMFLGVLFFTIQIYGDFSGYSDIALGTAKLFGFDLLINFRFPYFSRDLGEFWKRWHISLSSWFRDYLYIPLGGNRVSQYKQSFNLLVVFIFCGFWHGASWNFVIWGLSIFLLIVI